MLFVFGSHLKSCLYGMKLLCLPGRRGFSQLTVAWKHERSEGERKSRFGLVQTMKTKVFGIKTYTTLVCLEITKGTIITCVQIFVQLASRFVFREMLIKKGKSSRVLPRIQVLCSGGRNNSKKRRLLYRRGEPSCMQITLCDSALKYYFGKICLRV